MAEAVAAAPPHPRSRRRQGGRRAARAYRIGLGVSVLVAIGVVLAVVDTQSAQVPDTEGHGWAFSLLFGPGQPGLHREGWTVLTTGLLPDRARFTSLLRYHVAVDVVFIATYGLLLGALVLGLGRRRSWRVLGLVLVGLLVVSDLAEDAFALVAAQTGAGLTALLWLTQAKWVLVVLVTAAVVLRVLLPRPTVTPGTRTRGARLRRELRVAVTAVVHQRFSYAPVVAIFLLSVPSGAPILEQLPDAQRAWLFDGARGRHQAAAAIVCTGLLGLFLLAVGRERTVFALRPPEVSDRWTRFAVWLVGPVLALAGALLYLVEGRGALILVPRTLVWAAVPLLVVGVSVGIARLWRGHQGWYRPYEPPTFDEQEQFAVGIAGTVAAVGAVVTGGLSLLRALTPLLVLPAAAYLDDPSAGRPRMLYVLLVLAVVAVVGPWVALIGLARIYGGPDRPSLRSHAGRRTRRLVGVGDRVLRVRALRYAFDHRAWLLLVTATAAFLVLGTYPGWAARLGLAATATLALGSLAGMLSGVGLVLQDKPTAEVFRLLRLHRTPLVSLLVLTVVLVNALGSTGTLHEVDRGADEPVASRPSLAAAFGTWVDGPNGCGLTVDGHPVKPMLMLASEGGGIRATYWAVTGLRALDEGTCAASSTFFSGGASGGSVGLTVARFSGTDADPGAARAVEAVERMAEPGTLSQAADGTFVRDLVYGATGIPVPDGSRPDPYAWLDRARLIESGWSGSGDWGRRRFLDQTQVSPATGALILNSTSVTGNCRVWLSQLQLDAPAESQQPTFDPELTCDKVRGVAPRTIDLFAAYGPLNPADRRRCLDSLSTPTAAMLTARFPYLTPSGLVCPRVRVDRSRPTAPYWPRTQLVDGGYIENSGLATVTDLSHAWLPLVRQQNELALADRTGTEPLVVPVVVYLANGDRATAQPASGRAPVSELAVPPVTFLAARSALTNDEAQLARARDAVTLAGFCPDGHQDVCSRLDADFRSRVVVVDRATQPEVAAPLGWVMSRASLSSLRSDMDAQQRTLCPANLPLGVAAPREPTVADQAQARATCRAGYATLGDLRRYLTRAGS